MGVIAWKQMNKEKIVMDQKRIKVLIVDDNFPNRIFLAKCLEEYGTIISVDNGKEALLLFEQALKESKPFDLICLDIMMPEIDGRMVLKQIRTMEEERGINLKNRSKIIMLSALDDKDTVIGSFEDQCDGYLVKPFNREEIQECLVRFRWLI